MKKNCDNCGHLKMFGIDGFSCAARIYRNGTERDSHLHLLKANEYRARVKSCCALREGD